MARFKDYRAAHKKTVSDEELKDINLDAGNKGARHEHPEWNKTVVEVEEVTDKDVDVQRNIERKQKLEDRKV